MDFSGKVILITGASRGLGAICAKHLAGKGAELFLVSRSQDLLHKVIDETVNPNLHTALVCDFTDISQVKLLTDKLRNKNMEIDIVLHCAGGGLGMHQPLINYDDFQKLLMLNLSAAMEINRSLAKSLQEKKRGNLVHVGSIASVEAVGSLGYNIVKAALSAYVKSLGRELAQSGVVVTGILPGGFLAPGNAMERLQSNNLEAYESFIENRLPRKKMGQAEELLPLIEFLCSEHSGMMSGCMVPVDAAEGKAYL